MAGIIQNRQKSLIFIGDPKQRKQLNVISSTYGKKDNNKDYDSSNSNNIDTDKDNITNNDNNRNKKIA